MAIGDRIHELRTARQFTMEELGAKVGVGKGTIKKYEDGTIKNIPSDKVEALAEALETSPEYLMGWTDNEHPTQDQGLPGTSAQDEELQLMYDQFSQLSPAEQRRVLDFVAGILSAREP